MEVLKTRRDLPKQSTAYLVDGQTFYNAMVSICNQLPYVALTGISNLQIARDVPTIDCVSINISASGADCSLAVYTGITPYQIKIYTKAQRIVFPEDCRRMFADNSLIPSSFPIFLSSNYTRCDFSRINNMSEMFANSHISKIYVRGDIVFPQTAVSTDMFSGCTSLVGGSGTTYDANHTDGEYARIDNPPTAPGYFTAAT